MPVDLILTYRGSGWFQARTSYDVELAEKKFKLGAWVRAKLTVPRSIQQHRLFFKWVEKVWENAPFKRNEFPTAEHLRGHLLLKAGHVHMVSIPPETYGNGVEKVIRGIVSLYRTSEIDSVYFEERDGVVWALIPKSMNFGTMDHDEFQPLFDKCEAVVATEILPGVSLDELMSSLGDTK